MAPTSAGQKIKAFLAAGELAMKTANVLDEHYAEFATLEVRLHDLRNERTVEEQRLADIRDEITRTSASLRDEQVKLAAVQTKNNEQIGRQEARLKDLDATIREREAKAANVLEGLRALHDRIGV